MRRRRHEGEAPPALRVVTLNVWGLLPPASSHKKRRLASLARALPALRADVLCLQEVWCRADAAALTAAGAAAGLAHGVHFRCGPFGSGLVTLSRHPLVASTFTPYAAAGDPLALGQGDGVAGKGVGVVVVEVWGGGRTKKTRVAVANTHLAAAYRSAHPPPPKGRGSEFSVPGDANGGVRLAQAAVAAAALAGAAAAAGAAVAVLAGDLNAPPHSLEVALLKALLPAGTVDAWAAAGPATDAHAGATANRPGVKPTAGAGGAPARIDYVWAAGAAVAGCGLVFGGGGGAAPVSDHAGVAARLALAPSPPPLAFPCPPPPSPAIDASVALLRRAAAAAAAGGDAAGAAAAAAVLAAAALAAAAGALPPTLVPTAIAAAAALGAGAACAFWGGYAGRHALAASLAAAGDALSLGRG